MTCCATLCCVLSVVHSQPGHQQHDTTAWHSEATFIVCQGHMYVLHAQRHTRSVYVCLSMLLMNSRTLCMCACLIVLAAMQCHGNSSSKVCHARHSKCVMLNTQTLTSTATRVWTCALATAEVRCARNTHTKQAGHTSM